jgi:hypothetical protein
MRLSNEHDWRRRGTDSGSTSLGQMVFHAADYFGVREGTQIFERHGGDTTAEEHDDRFNFPRGRLPTKRREDGTDRFVRVCSEYDRKTRGK